MNKNILFLITLCCATNIIAGPKNKNPKNFAPAVKIDDPPPSPIEIPKSPAEAATLPNINLPAETLEQTRPLNSPRNSPLQVPTLSTPRLSAEEMKRLEAVKIFAETQETLKTLRSQGWDTAGPEDEALIKPKSPIAPKGWIQHFSEVPQQWWEEHVTNQNRVEYFMRYAGIVKTYTILCQKLNQDELPAFIADLNHSNAGEGNRWLDESLNQAIEDGREAVTIQLMNAAIPYKTALAPLTRSKVVHYLNKCADQKRKALCADNEDYATEMHALATTMREAEQDLPEIPIIPIETLEQSARDAALALTKCATGGYLPRQITQS